MPSVKGQLKRLEKRLKGDGDPDGKVLEWIRQGRRYNELTDEEKAAYIKYKESLGSGARDVAIAKLKIMLSDLTEDEAFNFRLTKRERPPTPEEHAQTVKEMERLMKEIQDEYNSPEEEKKREEEYQRAREIGRLRQQAYERGESMDKYPLPWQEGGKE